MSLAATLIKFFLLPDDPPPSVLGALRALAMEVGQDCPTSAQRLRLATILFDALARGKTEEVDFFFATSFPDKFHPLFGVDLIQMTDPHRLVAPYEPLVARETFLTELRQSLVGRPPGTLWQVIRGSVGRPGDLERMGVWPVSPS